MSGPLSTEDRLYAAMDRAALYFISILENDEKDEQGNDLYDIQLKMKLFDKGESWLLKRQKLKPSAGGGEGEGISELRSIMNDASAREMLRDMMFEEGFVRIPDPKPGRPTKQEEVVRQRFKAHKETVKSGKPPGKDDSGLQKLLTEGETS